MFFLVFSTSITFFVAPGHIPAIFDLWDPILSELSHSQNPQHFRTYLQYLETNTETRFIVWQSYGNLFHFSQLSDGKIIISNPNFFLEILKAVGLTFDWVPKLFQISFQAMEQKLVQRCETMVDADACMASYKILQIFYMSNQMFFFTPQRLRPKLNILKKFVINLINV